jgi:hypothetical protein
MDAGPSSTSSPRLHLSSLSKGQDENGTDISCRLEDLPDVVLGQVFSQLSLEELMQLRLGGRGIRERVGWPVVLLS